jgi:Domain of unknown function (DUF4258)
MDIEEIKTKVRANEYIYSYHADLERKADDLTLAQVEDALLTGEILEQYPDTGRGESCLVVGFSGDTPIHTVCGWGWRQSRAHHCLYYRSAAIC